MQLLQEEIKDIMFVEDLRGKLLTKKLDSKDYLYEKIKEIPFGTLVILKEKLLGNSKIASVQICDY